MTREGIDRRRFLTQPALVAGGLALCGALPVAVSAISGRDAGFASLAAFLTGRTDLEPGLVTRAGDALRKADPRFESECEALLGGIRQANITSVDELKESALGADARTMATATSIIAAFYLGRVGDGDRAELVSYELALMFRPTADVTVVPTYARAGPGYWEEDDERR